MRRAVLVVAAVSMFLGGCAQIQRELNGSTQGWISRGCATREIAKDTHIYPCVGENGGTISLSFKKRFF